ncbi:MAG TPA: phage baseplate assembly protein V [Polyangia bacterium]|nr:phage baseplate assembly protein V [Polyangia bacterium]
MRSQELERAPLQPRLGTHLAEVVSVKDTTGRGRVQIRLYDHDNVGKQDAPIWARVAVPFAGSKMGAFFIPGKGDEVLVSFLNGDPRLPIVVGGLWNGNAKQSETLGGAGDQVDRWTLTGKNGTRIAIVEEQAGAVIKLSTPQGITMTMTDQSGGKVEIKQGGTTITSDSQGVTVKTSGKIAMTGSQMNVTAGQVSFTAAKVSCSSILQAVTVQASTVISGVYTTGAGNVL